MTKLLLKLSGLVLALTFLISTGCNPEDDTPIITLGPDLFFVADPGFLTTDAELNVGETFKVKLRAERGDNDLRTLSFTFDGINPQGAALENYIKAISAGGSSLTPNNPQLIVGAATGGTTFELEIFPFNQVLNETVTYAFTLEDNTGRRATASLDITISGTPLQRTLEGVLFNQAGPMGTGGLDLDEGAGVGSADPNAEIRDLGINCTIDPDLQENWRRQIGSVNGTNMVKVNVAAQAEGFTFDKVETREVILAAYDTGITLADGFSTNAQCVQTPVTDVSDPVVVGDMFAIRKGDRYYIIRIDEVNPSAGNNQDNYRISIKY
jgi:hypothetical protein